MSKERLEESKNVIEDIEDLQNERGFRQADIAKCYLVEKHGRWLIEQAERVQELESIISQNESVMYRLVGEEEMWQQGTYKTEMQKLEEQNKRYREALEAIAGIDHIEKSLEQEVVQVAYEALEGDPHESS